MAKGSRSYRLFLEVDLFHVLPALYSDEFIEYTFQINLFLYNFCI